MIKLIQMSETSKKAVEWLKKQAEKRKVGKLGAIRRQQTEAIINSVNKN